MDERDNWIIARGWGGFERMQVTKATEKQVKAIDGYKRPRTVPRNEVVAVTDEEQSMALLERLVSSDALAKQEASAAHDRHRQRVAKLVADLTPSKDTP